jgi:hypothetical protein
MFIEAHEESERDIDIGRREDLFDESDYLERRIMTRDIAGAVELLAHAGLHHHFSANHPRWHFLVLEPGRASSCGTQRVHVASRCRERQVTIVAAFEFFDPTRERLSWSDDWARYGDSWMNQRQ